LDLGAKDEFIIQNMSSTLDDFRNFYSPTKLKKPFSPLVAINSTIKMVGKQYEHENIDIVIDGNEEIIVIGKENEFKQVVVNLFNNSRDAFIARGVVKRIINVYVTGNDSSVQVVISDNAGGIPADIIEHIFEQFYTTKGDNGNGIGLHLCKTIIENSFGGTIGVSNNESGAEFTITLPAGK
jgi:signal transduction histidine kinase